jgi:hypothetical protein
MNGVIRLYGPHIRSFQSSSFTTRPAAHSGSASRANSSICSLLPGKGISQFAFHINRANNSRPRGIKHWHDHLRERIPQCGQVSRIVPHITNHNRVLFAYGRGSRSTDDREHWIGGRFATSPRNHGYRFRPRVVNSHPTLGAANESLPRELLPLRGSRSLRSDNALNSHNNFACRDHPTGRALTAAIPFISPGSTGFGRGPIGTGNFNYGARRFNAFRCSVRAPRSGALDEALS